MSATRVRPPLRPTVLRGGSGYTDGRVLGSSLALQRQHAVCGPYQGEGPGRRILPAHRLLVATAVERATDWLAEVRDPRRLQDEVMTGCDPRTTRCQQPFCQVPAWRPS